jgi:anti-sigma factor RsiW
MTDCPKGEMRDRLPEFVNGTLDARARAAGEGHLAGCEDCRAEVALLRGVRAALLARAPKMDTARIANAVRASRAHGARRSWSPAWSWSAAAAVLVAAALAFGYWAGRRPTEPLPEVGIRPAPAPVVAPRAAPAPAPIVPDSKHYAQTPAPKHVIPAPARPAGLSFGGGAADLDDRQLNALMQSLDKLAPELDAEPESELDLGAGR